MRTTCVPAISICVIDSETGHATVKEYYYLFLHPDPPPPIHTLLLVSLTIRCCEINGHSEIDLRPRRGMKRRTLEKNQWLRVACNKNMPGLIKFQCSYQQPHTCSLRHDKDHEEDRTQHKIHFIWRHWLTSLPIAAASRCKVQPVVKQYFSDYALLSCLFDFHLQDEEAGGAEEFLRHRAR